MDNAIAGPAGDELIAHELAVLTLADMLWTITADLPARRSLPDLAEAMIGAYPETTREIVLAGLAATDPANLESAPQSPETRRRGHLRLVPRPK